jgi:hypothetical protein
VIAYISGMPARKHPDPDAKSRLERITEVAREAECDEDGEAFKAKLALIAQHKPKDDQTKPPSKIDGSV